MIKLKSFIKIFLEDKFSNILERGEGMYQKVQYNDSLTLLNYCDEFKLRECKFEFLGVYSKTLGEIILFSNAYDAKYLIADDNEESIPHFGKLVEELNYRVKQEVENILELQVKPVSKFSAELLETASSYVVTKRTPIFDYEFEELTLSLENIEEYCTDKDDYAYSIAEEAVSSNEECITSYQEYANLKAAMEYVQNDIPINLEIEQKIRNVLMFNSTAKNFKMLLTKNGHDYWTEETERTLLRYPVYAIQKIMWGRSTLLDITEFDQKKLDDLRTDVEYNEKVFSNAAVGERDLVCDYMDKSLFSNYDFVLFYVQKNGDFERIDEKFRNDITFLKSNKEYIHYYNCLKYVSESVIMANKDYFMDMITRENASSFYKMSPASVKTDEDFVVKCIELRGSEMIEELEEVMFNNPNVQRAFDDWYITNGSNPFYNTSYYYEKSKKPINLIQNRRTKILAMTLKDMVNLDKSDLNDKDFIMEYLDRLEDINRGENVYSEIFLQNLDKLVADKDVVLRTVSVLGANVLCWNEVDDTIQSDFDFQRLCVNMNKEMLYLMDDSVKEEFLIKDACTYLPYRSSASLGGNKKIFNRHYDADLLIDLVEKGASPECFKFLSYEDENNLKIANKLLDLSLDNYEYLGSKAKSDIKIAKRMIKDRSIIPYLPEKTKWNRCELWDNKEIMMESIKHSPLDFGKIPKASRQAGPAPLLEDKEFIMFALEQESYNASYLPAKSLFREDEDVAYLTLTMDISEANNFAKKLYRDEMFVYKLCTNLKEQLDQKTGNAHDAYLEEIKEYFLCYVPKKITNMEDFKNEFPEFVV